MAVFGRDFYGIAKYGANIHTEYDVAPFDASPEGYGALRVTWHSPSGAWDRLRLLRSKSGYAVDESDGTILIDAAEGVDHFVDNGVQAGSWTYYTLFIQDTDGVWNRAGATSGLAVKKPWIRSVGDIVDLHYEIQQVPYGHAELLWDRIPSYFKYIRRDHAAITDDYFLAPNTQAFLLNPDIYDQENQHLRMLLDVIGWGLDYVHNYQETLLRANDPHTAHLQDVDRLARELGIDFEYGVPASVMRSKVANAALLARRRGTLQGLQDVAALSTGWDVDIQVGPNLFLNRDQSEFANPIFPEWDSGTNYATGQKIQYEGRIFTAIQGAYGDAMKPPPTGTNSNGYWTVTTGQDVTTLHRADTDSVVTWVGYMDGTERFPINLVVGVSDSVSGVGQESNALRVENADIVARTFDVLGAANLVDVNDLLPHPSSAIRQGVPIPRPTLWDPETEYGLGALVQHLGSSWRAIGTSLNETPSKTSLYWEQVGVDDRPLLAYSMYAHGPLTGTAGSGGVSVTPGVAFFDEQGNLLVDQTDLTVPTNYVFDSFNHPFGTPDYGTLGNWSTTGTWDTEAPNNSDDLVAYPVSGTGVALQTVPGTLTQYRVAATFAKAAMTGHVDGLAIRYVDASNYMQVTRTRVLLFVAGTKSTVATFATPIQDGDRVTMKINDVTSTFTVFVNGTQVASGSLTGGSSPYKHGIMVN
jgi:hypothetical protein